MRNKDIAVRFYIKQPYSGRYPTKLVFATPSQVKGVQQIEKRGKRIHLPVVSRSKKVNILLMRVA
jgi:hypothetical protein